MAGRLYEEKESQGAAVLFSKENRNNHFLMERVAKRMTPFEILPMMQTAAAGEDGLLRDGAALWLKEKRVYDFSKELEDVLRRQAEKEPWKVTTAMVRAMAPVVCIITHDGKEEAAGLLIWRCREALHFQSFHPDGRAGLSGMLPLGTGIRPFRECLAEADDAIRPLLAEWLELFLYTLAGNKEVAERTYCFPGPDGKEADIIWLSTGEKTGETIRRDREWLEREEKEGFPIIMGYRKLPHPHIRVSHWHEYHMGTRRKLLEDRPIAIRWVAPVLINREAYESYKEPGGVKEEP